MSDTIPKTKYPREAAIAVAKVLCDALKPVTERLIVAGSLRRLKPMVGDVEILYIPKLEPLKEVRQAELLEELAPPPRMTNMADLVLNALLTRGVIEQRRNTLGSIVWGEKNKLARHCMSGIPVDLFSATDANWFNYLVCRTGGAENNVQVCNAAIAKGWKWNPYNEGFTDQEGNTVRVESEEDVFRLAGLPFKLPKDRT